jgi:hypothetical protein
MRTKITNTAGETRHFGYLPPHGINIAAGGEVVLDGDLRTILAGGLGRYNRRREIAALDGDVAAGTVAVESYPDPSSSSSSSSSAP